MSTSNNPDYPYFRGGPAIRHINRAGKFKLGQRVKACAFIQNFKGYNESIVIGTRWIKYHRYHDFIEQIQTAHDPAGWSYVRHFEVAR
jgi:hypothetical protein